MMSTIKKDITKFLFGMDERQTVLILDCLNSERVKLGYLTELRLDRGITLEIGCLHPDEPEAGVSFCFNFEHDEKLIMTAALESARIIFNGLVEDSYESFTLSNLRTMIEAIFIVR